MERKETPVMGYAALILCALAVVAVVARVSQSDVALCRGVFTGLAEGRASVSSRIDWESLKALDVDVGAAYRRLPNAQERQQYAWAFIEQFSRGFEQAGADPRAFVGWRRHQQRDGQRIIAADYPAKQRTLLMGCSGGWNRKVTSIQWQ